MSKRKHSGAVSQTDSASSHLTTVSDMGIDIRYKHFENIKKCNVYLEIHFLSRSGFKYVDRAVQEYIESMIKLNFVDDVTQVKSY